MSCDHTHRHQLQHFPTTSQSPRNVPFALPIPHRTVSHVRFALLGAKEGLGTIE